MKRSNVWGGNSGIAFAEMIRVQLESGGRTARLSVRPVGSGVAPPGAYLIEVQVHDGPELLVEVADWVEGVRIMDPDGEDLSRARALNYISLRSAGRSPGDALRDC